MPLADILFGCPLASEEDPGQRVSAAQGVPIFGLDALSSAAYGPEAALTILLPLGLAGIVHIVPLRTAIIVLLAIVYSSYRQTIAAYPTGAGSYTVAKENLGETAGQAAHEGYRSSRHILNRRGRSGLWGERRSADAHVRRGILTSLREHAAGKVARPCR